MTISAKAVSSRHPFPSEDEDCFFDVTRYPEGPVLPDPLSEPVTKAKILIYQEASHPALTSLAPLIASPVPTKTVLDKYLARR